MQNYYFTYGSEGNPFKGGWTRVRADSLYTAVTAFQIYHPDRVPYILNCAHVYTEEEFKRTTMFRNGNLGEYCHEIIDLYRSVITEDEK